MRGECSSDVVSISLSYIKSGVRIESPSINFILLTICYFQLSGIYVIFHFAGGIIVKF